jgi:aryl-alcohol dehydrogenase-like predicted oxidoreductase
MQMTKLGTLDVSVMALGAMLFGTTTDEATSRRLLDAFVDRGGNFIDTSNNYAFWPPNGRSGASEELLGRWLKDRGRHDDLIIATKVGARPNQPGGSFDDIEGLSAEVIARNVDESLRRLGVDRIDLYYAHIDDRTTPLEETLAALDAVVKAGKVRTIACSNYSVWRIEQARQLSRRLGYAEYAALQQQFSYFRPQPKSDPVMSEILRHRRGGWGHGGGLAAQHIDYIREDPDFRVVAYTPLLRGAYSDPAKLPDNYRTPENEKRSVALAAVVAETGATVNQVVLAWLLQSEPQILPLISASRMEQLAENLGAVDLTLSPDQMRQLDDAA